MKNLRQICATLALSLVFALPAFADGYILLDKAPPSPSSTAAADGYITIGKAGQPADTMTEITLSLLQSVLTLF